MRKRTFRFLTAALSFASGLLLMVGSAGAVTFSYNMTLDGVTSADYTTSATYNYAFSQNAGSSTLSYIDFEIPAEIGIPAGAFAGGTSKFSVTYYANGAGAGVLLGGEVYDVGVGDYGTKFGVGDTRYRVMKVNIPAPAATFRVALSLKGQTFASGRIFADASGSDYGVVLIKAGNGSNTQTFTLQTPTIVNPPVSPRPVFSTLSVFPNPVVLPDCATVSWTLSDPLATVTIDPYVAVSGNQASICLAAAGTYAYTITATGAGGSATESFTVTAVNAPPPPLVFSLSVLPNPVTPPGCATVRWDRRDAVVTINPSGAATISSDPADPAYATICFGPETAPGTHTFQIMATVPGGSTATVSFAITTNPPPVIETTCKQIRKNGVSGQYCIYVCLSTSDGGLQNLESATWFNTADCSGSGVPLAIYGQDSPEKTLVCNPCRVDVDPSHPQVCPANTDPSVTPFRYEQLGVSGNPYKNCDIFKYERQDQGFAAVLGTDPWVVINGRQVWVR
ncbi:MAG TPA: hypothetical protein VI078_17895 [bacterium]